MQKDYLLNFVIVDFYFCFQVFNFPNYCFQHDIELVKKTHFESVFLTGNVETEMLLIAFASQNASSSC